eukprot:Skav236147  [mRNA]  locus=scaffold2146:102764:103297:+ [translate_table: standard]
MPVGVVCQLNYQLSGCVEYRDPGGKSALVSFLHSPLAVKIGQRVTFSLREINGRHEAVDLQVEPTHAPTASNSLKDLPLLKAKSFLRSMGKFHNGQFEEKLQMLLHAQQLLEKLLDEPMMVMQFVDWSSVALHGCMVQRSLPVAGTVGALRWICAMTWRTAATNICKKEFGNCSFLH